MNRTVAWAMLLCPFPAVAGDFQSKPIPGESDVVTYYKGTPIVERTAAFGKVRVTSIEEEIGKPAFVVEILNQGEAPINFGTENITARVAGQKKPTVIYTAKDVQRMVQNKAGWATFITEVSGASATNTSYGSACGYYGCVTANVTTPNYVAQANAARQVDEIRNNEANYIDELSQNYLQLTTVQSGQNYGGRVAISKPKPKKWPAMLTLTVLGEVFLFEMTK